MLIDCETCIARDIACHDCVITVLLRNPVPLGQPHDPVDLDDDEQAAIGTLAGAGLVPPLRLVPKGSGTARPDRKQRGIA